MFKYNHFYPEKRKISSPNHINFTRLYELKTYPYHGTGHPEPLRYLGGNIWSRRLDKKKRLRYIVQEDVVIVTVVSVLGYYDDK